MAPGLCPVLVGPTAVGKTGLVLELAARFPLEVVSLDSRQVYAGLRIGTAQPDAAERERCPHHLVDFLSPDTTYSAQRFREDALAAVEDVRSRGRLPLLVGGAGLYLEALRQGLLAIDAGPDERAAVRAEFAALSDAEARARLLEVDAPSWRRIPAGDGYRIRRALEVARLTGRPLSAWRRERRPEPAGGHAYPSVLLTRTREELRARIARRTDAMLAAGWIAETQAALDAWPPDVPGLRTLGYRELVRHLAGEIPLETAREEIVLRSRQYAKRQVTWFRRRDHVATGAPGSPAVRGVLERLLARAGSS